MPVTIRQVAEAVGVSDVVVSRVLNGGTSTTVRVGAATRARIVASAEQLGYRPSGAARSMRKGRTEAVALVLPAVEESAWLPAAFPKRAAARLAAGGYHMTLAILPDSRLTDEHFVPRILRELAVDGLLINYITRIPQRMAEMIERFAVPAVWLNTDRPTDAVRPADFDGGVDATRRLLALGHRRIEFLTFGGEDHYSFIERRRGYEAAMREAGLQPRVTYHPWRPYPEPDTRVRHAREMLRRPDRPTAVVGYAAREVAPLMTAALELRMDVPRDLSVLGFHDTILDAGGRAVATLAQSATKLSEAAVDLLMRKIADPGTPLPSQTVPFVWYDAESYAPPSP